MLCTECKQTQLGREYMGTLSTTVSGRTCQAWASNTPHDPNSYVEDDSNYPDGSREAASNYCRNPDWESGGPWCYTLDPDERWEYCDIPFCNGTCIMFIVCNRKELQNVAIPNTLQLKSARRSAVSIRFNFSAHVKFEVAQPIRCPLRALLLPIRYVTL